MVSSVRCAGCLAAHILPSNSSACSCHEPHSGTLPVIFCSWVPGVQLAYASSTFGVIEYCVGTYRTVPYLGRGLAVFVFYCHRSSMLRVKHLFGTCFV